MKIRMWKKITLGVFFVVVIIVSLYFTYFRHPPPGDILAANMAAAHGGGGGGGGCCCQCDDDYDDDDSEADSGDVSPQKEAAKRWAKFIKKNNLVSVGSLYTKCEGDDKIMMGTVIMLPDPKSGGVMTRTFANVTIEQLLTGGEVHVVSHYNGKELYSSVWDLCTAEDGMEDHVIECPIQPGKRAYVKDLPIPGYLPKGKYYSKAWANDPDDKELGCSISEFTI